MMPPVFLDTVEILEIHRDQIKRYGGTPGMRDFGLLKSCVAMPRSGMRGKYFHADIFQMAAAYLYHIVRNHPFVDGNKRTGAVVALVFLAMNGISVNVSQDSLVEIVTSAAAGKTSKDEIAEYFRNNSSGAK